MENNMVEVWRIIPGHELYMASNFGRVVNGKTGKESTYSLTGSKKKNMQYLSAYIGISSRTTKIHRLVLTAFKGIPKKGQIGCHRNDEKFNNHLENLYWGTYKTNTRDSINKGTFRPPPVRYGDKAHGTKYPEQIVKEIREEYFSKPRKRRDGTLKMLSEKHGVPFGTVSDIIRGRSRRRG